MRTSLMTLPTGCSSSPISSRTDEISYSSEAPQAQLGGILLERKMHCIVPLIHGSGWMQKQERQVAGIEHDGIEWISVTHYGHYGSQRLRSIHNARGIRISPLTQGDVHVDEPVIVKMMINDESGRSYNGDIELIAPSGGIFLTKAGRYFPPGSLQIVVDGNDKPVSNEYTTLPTPYAVQTVPCSGWCKKQHVYTEFGMTEKAVIFFNGLGWPIACRENLLNGQDRIGARWWRFDYSRPMELSCG